MSRTDERESHRRTLELDSGRGLLSQAPTGLDLEPDLYSVLQEIADRERRTVDEVCAGIARRKPANVTLVSAVRVYILRYLQDRTAKF